jgi:hypothetical protein
LHHAQKEEAQSVHTSNFNCHADPRNYKSQDVVSIATWKNEILTDENWIYGSGACGHHYESDKDFFAVKEINEKITVGNSENMKETKVGSLKCHVVQLKGSSVEVTLKEVNYASES